MELNREQIIKALECCADENSCEGKCPYHSVVVTVCTTNLAKDALSLIKELTEENERLRERADRHLENLKAVLNERNESTIRADTVRKMQVRLKAKAKNNEWNGTICGEDIDQIAKEMLEGKI